MFATLKNTLKSTAYFTVGTSLFVAISLASLALNKASPFESTPAPSASALAVEVRRIRASSVSSDSSSSTSVPSSRSSSDSNETFYTSTSSRSNTPTSKPSPAEVFAAFHKDTYTRPYKTTTSIKKYTSIVEHQRTSFSRRTTRQTITYSSFSDLYLISQ